MPNMWNIETALSGQNLELYRNIQETIRLTQQKVNTIKERFSQEDILPILRSKRSVGTSLSSGSGEFKAALTLVSSTGDIGIKAWDKDDVYHARKKAISGVRDLASERSDFMYDEVNPKPDINYGRLSKITQTSSQEKFLGAKESLAPADQPKPEGITNEEIDMRLHDKLTPEEQKMIYERICDAYGQESGRRYLLVRSMNTPDRDGKIYAWTTTKCSPLREKKFSKVQVSCPESTPLQHKFICTNVCDSVKKKMETLVDITPWCTNNFKPKHRKWKNNFKEIPPSTHGQAHVSAIGDKFSPSGDDTYSDNTPCQCSTYRCNCGQLKEECNIPEIKKGCDLMANETNNFLITCRENLQDKKLQDRRVTVLQLNAMKVANTATRESAYLQSSHNQTKIELESCLMKVKPPQGQEATEKGQNHVEQLANFFGEHKMIPEHEWRALRQAEAEMANVENSDELDSIDSDILTFDSSEDDMSECNLQVSNLEHPSRIPYFKETYELAEVFFDKLNAKMEKLISKNHNRRQIKKEHPMTFALLENINLLRSSSKIFNQITKCHKTHHNYPKKLTPFSERRRRKCARANIMKNELLRKQRFRKRVEGIQLGRRYKMPNRSLLFTKSENFRGFSPRRRKLLREYGDVKFAKYNLVAKHLAGRAVGQKALHRDYRMIRRMFDDDMNRHKESLWDLGMMGRLKEYLGMFQDVKQPEEEYEQEEDTSKFSLAASQRRPKKDEQKTQTAMPYSESHCSGKSGNAAEALTSIIRSLQCEAKSHGAYDSIKTQSVADSVMNPQARTLQSNVSTKGPGSERSGRKSSDFGQGSRWKSHHIPSMRRISELNHTYTLGSNATLEMPQTIDSASIPRSDCTKRHIPRKMTLEKPASASKTLPLLHSNRPNIKHLPRNSRCKSSKTVR